MNHKSMLDLHNMDVRNRNTYMLCLLLYYENVFCKKQMLTSFDNHTLIKPIRS